MFRNPTPEAEELAALYADSWSTPRIARAETGGTTGQLARAYVALLQQTLGLTDFAGLRILDLGAGRGEMAEALRERKAQVCAVEPFGFELLRRKKIQVVRSLADLPPGLRFDGAVAVDVVEHLARPWSDLAALRGSLREGAFLYVSTMNAHGLNAVLSGARWRELLKPGHLVFFTAATLRAALRAAGFATVRRLRWQVAHYTGALRAARHRMLQALGLDGELRVIARDGAGPQRVDRLRDPH